MVSRCKYVSINADLIKEAVVKKKKKRTTKNKENELMKQDFRAGRLKKRKRSLLLKHAELH